MFTSLLAAWNNFFGATKAVSTEVTQRDAEKNTVQQRSNAQAADMQKLRDESARAINSPDQTEIDRMTDE